MEKTVRAPQQTENTNGGRDTTTTQHQVPGISGRTAEVNGGEIKTDSWSADAQSHDGRNTRSVGRRDPSAPILRWRTHVSRVGSSRRAIGCEDLWSHGGTAQGDEESARNARRLFQAESFRVILCWWDWWAILAATGLATHRRGSRRAATWTRTNARQHRSLEDRVAWQRAVAWSVHG